MQRYGSKILVAILLCSLVGGTISFPKPAHAILLTTEDNPVVLITNTETSVATNVTAGAAVEGTVASNISASSQTILLGESLLKWAGEAFVQGLKKALLNYLVDRVIAYIKGAKDGGFVGDWQSYLSGALATGLQQFALNFTNIDICAPFSAQLKLAFAIPEVGQFSQKYTCDFDSIGENIEDFYADFRKGGWIAYSKSWEPQNNMYGIFLSASVEQAAEASAAQDAARAEASAGAGFLGKKECTEKLDTSDLDGALPGPDLDGDGQPNDDPASCHITTPGQTVAASLQKSLDSEFDYINSLTGTNIGPYVAAIVDAMVGRVLEEGLSLVAAHAPSSPSVGDYVDVSSINRTDSQRFRSQSQRTAKDVKEAIQLRESAQAFAQSAATKWLKFTHGATDIVSEAARQIREAQRVLIYVYNELNKVTRKTQINPAVNDGNDSTFTKTEQLCSPVKTVAIIDDRALPRLRAQIDRATDALDTLDLADDEPDASGNPLTSEFVAMAEAARAISAGDRAQFFELLANGSLDELGIDPASIDSSDDDNPDQIELLKEVQFELDNDLVENSPETRYRLSEIQNTLAGDVIVSARQFKTAMKKIDNDIEGILKNASSYANRLKACFNPRNELDLKQGVVVAWTTNDPGDESISKPARNPGFPWETDVDADPDASENTSE